MLLANILSIRDTSLTITCTKLNENKVSTIMTSKFNGYLRSLKYSNKQVIVVMKAVMYVVGFFDKTTLGGILAFSDWADKSCIAQEYVYSSKLLLYGYVNECPLYQEHDASC